MNEEEIKLMSKLQENAIRYKFMKRNNMIFDMDKYYDDYVLFELIQRLQQENQQLKEELQKADSITQSCIFEGKEESEINFRKAINLIEQYKSVLDEIREYIEKECCDLLIGYFHNRFDTTEYYEKILQILDKVK